MDHLEILPISKAPVRRGQADLRPALVAPTSRGDGRSPAGMARLGSTCAVAAFSTRRSTSRCRSCAWEARRARVGAGNSPTAIRWRAGAGPALTERSGAEAIQQRSTGACMRVLDRPTDPSDLPAPAVNHCVSSRGGTNGGTNSATAATKPTPAVGRPPTTEGKVDRHARPAVNARSLRQARNSCSLSADEAPELPIFA
jgi:hypothetical protein